MTTQIDENLEYLSKERFEELQKKLVELKTTRRIEIAQRLEYAKSLGDLSENAEYAEAKEEQMINEAEVMKLEDLLSRAQLISSKTSEFVQVGSTVFARRAGAHKEQFMIVGKEEADPLKGKISHESPLGRSFLGKKKNEKFNVSTPKGQIEYQIIDIA